MNRLYLLSVSWTASLEANWPTHCGSAYWTTAAVYSSGGPTVSFHIQTSTNSLADAAIGLRAERLIIHLSVPDSRYLF